MKDRFGVAAKDLQVVKSQPLPKDMLREINDHIKDSDKGGDKDDAGRDGKEGK